LTAGVCCIQTGGDVCCPSSGEKPPCMPDPQWQKYNTFTLDDGTGKCDSFDSFAVALPAKVFGIDPLALAGSKTKITFTGMLQNSSGQNDACKNTATAAPVDCMTDDDCVAAANKPGLDPKCVTALQKASCVEGTCRRGVFNFWNIIPRTPDDIVVNK
jgi:hypothetical protein